MNFSTGEASALTDAQGFYAFDGLANGSYTSRYAEAGWTPATVASHPFTITGPSSIFTGLNFGVGRNNRFYAHVFNDLDADGAVDGGEGPRAGRKIFIDSNNNGVEDAPLTNNFAAAPNIPLPNLVTVDVPILVSGITGNVSDINLTINMTHPWVGDLDLTLIAPNWAQAKFFDNHGVSEDNLTNTVFDDEAATSIAAGTPPYTGSFRPFQPFTVFDGMTPAQANGTWLIRMFDVEAPDTGVLQNYNLKIDHGVDEFDLGNWATAPNTSLISNTLLTGTTRRIQLEWTDGSIVECWIRVTIKANVNTGLAAPEILYLGHKSGEVNGQITNLAGTQPFGRFTVTNLGDVAPIRAALNQSGLTADSFVDLNKSGSVNNLGDVAPVRASINSQLTVIQMPANPAPAPNFGNGSAGGGRSSGSRVFGGLDQENDSKSDSVSESWKRDTQIVDEVFVGFDSQLIGNSINISLGKDDLVTKKGKKASGNLSQVSVDLAIGF